MTAQWQPLDLKPAAPAAEPGGGGSQLDGSVDPLLCRRLSLLTAHLVVALVALVVIGGATRVMEAGLACPDWPLCYGTLLPGRQMNLQVFLEWFHRLDAFVVGVALLVLAALAGLRRRQLPAGVPALALLALLLVAFQGLLGALTVTRLLAAPVVTAHLGTALLLVALLSGLHQRLERALRNSRDVLAGWPARLLPPLSVVAGLLLLAQCLLGGAMASQWAANLCLASGRGCRWLLWHRQLAQAAALAVLLLGAVIPERRWGMTLAAAVLAQVALGVLTLRQQLAVPLITVAHQLLAALLVALVAAVLSRLLPPSAPYPAASGLLSVPHG
jgi:cytochrome c oxidase assembly protein subunit 15